MQYRVGKLETLFTPVSKVGKIFFDTSDSTSFERLKLFYNSILFEFYWSLKNLKLTGIECHNVSLSRLTYFVIFSCVSYFLSDPYINQHGVLRSQDIFESYF